MRSCRHTTFLTRAATLPVFNDAGLTPLLAKPAHQRVDGAARVVFKRAGGGTVLGDLFQRSPCRVLFPDVEAGEPAQAVLLTTSGGLTDGDRIALELEAGAATRACFTTQAAEKLYRALDGGADTRVDVSLRVGAGAFAEYLAQETILFDGAKLRRGFSADIEGDGRMLAVESIVFGRSAMGERYTRGGLHDGWRIRRDGRLVWADTLRLQGDIAAQRALPFGLGGAKACATLVYVGGDAAGLLGPLRERLAAHAAIGAATSFDGLLIVRVLADDVPALRAAVLTAAGALRQLAASLPQALPRVWYC